MATIPRVDGTPSTTRTGAEFDVLLPDQHAQPYPPTRIRKKMYFLGYTKMHSGYSEIQFKSAHTNAPNFKNNPPQSQTPNRAANYQDLLTN